MQNLQLDNNAIVNSAFAYPPGKPPDRGKYLATRVICHKQLLQGQNKFPDFEINKLELNKYYHSPHFLKAGKVVLWTPLYVHVLVIIGVSNCNSECMIKTEDGTFEGMNPEELLWIDHFSPLMAITHRIKTCAYLPKLAERFC